MADLDPHIFNPGWTIELSAGEKNESREQQLSASEPAGPPAPTTAQSQPAPALAPAVPSRSSSATSPLPADRPPRSSVSFSQKSRSTVRDKPPERPTTPELKPRHPLTSLLFCMLCLSSRPKYTKIQHVVLPTSQVHINPQALQFLQAMPNDEFQLLQFLVQEVFTEDGAKVLSRIPDYDPMIEAALTEQIVLVPRPWDRVTRQRYVEHLAGLYARLLRKMGTYERSPMCEAVYGRRWRSWQKKESARTDGA